MKYVISLIFLMAASGCESFQYLGVAPNVRTFSEEPRLSQYYIGFDLEFSLIDPPTDPNQPLGEELSAAPQFPEDPDVVPRPLPEPNIPW